MYLLISYQVLRTKRSRGVVKSMYGDQVAKYLAQRERNPRTQSFIPFFSSPYSPSPSYIVSYPVVLSCPDVSYVGVFPTYQVINLYLSSF